MAKKINYTPIHSSSCTYLYAYIHNKINTSMIVCIVIVDYYQ